MAKSPDRVLIGAAEHERLKAAEETCWSLFLAIGLGGLEEVPTSVRQWIVEGGMEKWSRLCAEQGLMLEEEPREAEPEGQAQEDVLPDRLHHLLMLVADEFPSPVPSRDWIASMWTAEVRREVQNWAVAVHLSASDNDDVVIPPMPEVLKR